MASASSHWSVTPPQSSSPSLRFHTHQLLIFSGQSTSLLFHHHQYELWSYVSRKCFRRNLIIVLLAKSPVLDQHFDESLFPSWFLCYLHNFYLSPLHGCKQQQPPALWSPLSLSLSLSLSSPLSLSIFIPLSPLDGYEQEQLPVRQLFVSELPSSPPPLLHPPGGQTGTKKKM